MSRCWEIIKLQSYPLLTDCIQVKSDIEVCKEVSSMHEFSCLDFPTIIPPILNRVGYKKMKPVRLAYYLNVNP